MAVLVGHARTGYRWLVLGDRKSSKGLRQLSRMLYKTYMAKIGLEPISPASAAPVEKTEEEVCGNCWMPNVVRPYEMRAALRAALGCRRKPFLRPPQLPRPTRRHRLWCRLSKHSSYQWAWDSRSV